ncbi:MAG: YfhO family protein [Eggerthellaceae bacterium]|nr:YfhO family protein [Eggerthellaceae bacterium]
MRARVAILHVLSFVLPLVILGCVYTLRGMYPFGETGVAVWDMDIQYIGYFEWLRDVLHGQGSPFYSFSMGMGENTAALVAYHLSSPFNLLLAFWGEGSVVGFFNVAVLLKLSCAGATFFAFARNRWHLGAAALLASTSYALCGWAFAQASNVMWLDGFIMLPLVAWGTYRAVEGERYGLLFCSVALAVLFNWYTAYMDCLLSLLLFLVYRWEVTGASRPVGEGVSRAERIARACRRVVASRSTLRYIVTMVLALCASMVLFLPSMMCLMQGTESSFSLLKALMPIPLFPPWDIGAYAVSGVVPETSTSRVPALYMSAFVLVVATLLFCDRGVSKRKRIALAVLLACAVAGVMFVGPSVVWSDMKLTTSFYFRHGYVVAFVLAVCACEELCSFRRACDGSGASAETPQHAALFHVRVIRCVVVLVVVVLASSALAIVTHAEGAPSGLAVAATVASLLASGILLVAWHSCSQSASPVRGNGGIAVRVVLCVAVAAVSVDVGFSAYQAFRVYGSSVDAHAQEQASIDALVQSSVDDAAGQDGLLVNMAGADRDGTRAQTQIPQTTALFTSSVQSVGEYTSMVNGSLYTMLSALGYTENDPIFGYYSNSSQLLADSLLGVDYVLSATQPAGDVTLVSPAALYEYDLYRYNASLPAGYGIAGSGSVSWGSDPFANQMLMLQDATGGDGALSAYVDADVSEVSRVVEGACECSFQVTVEQDGPLYLDFPVIAQATQNHCWNMVAQVCVNGAPVELVGSNFSGNVLYAGTFSEGDTVQVALSFAEPQASCVTVLDGEQCKGTVEECVARASASDLVVAKTLDEDVLADCLAALDAEGFSVLSWEDGHVTATFDASSSELLMLRIPYAPGWEAFVDGERVSVVSCYTGLSGVWVEEGSHTVELRFTPPGLYVGIALSAFGVLAFFVLRRRWES